MATKEVFWIEGAPVALLELGWKPKAALSAVEACGCQIPDTHEQKEWILRYRAQP